MSVVLVATIVPKPESRDEVVAAFEAAASRVHAEDQGCERYAMHDDGDKIVMIEKWASMEAMAAHSTSPALTELGDKIKGLLAERPAISVLTPHPAGDPKLGSL
jgi:quinol monooxygenase YgiN